MASFRLAAAKTVTFTLRDGVRVQVSGAHRQLEASRVAAASAQSALTAAEEAYRVRVAQYEVGAGVAVDVLDADLALTRARLDRLNAVLDAHLAWADLRWAAGRS